MSNRYFNKTSRFNCGEAINWVIDHTDYKKKEIANFLHISPSTLTGYLTNNRTPDIYTLLKLCDICKVDPNQLFGYRLSLYIMNKKEQDLVAIFRSADSDVQDKLLIMMKAMKELADSLGEKK